ncbi:MAG: hypothetical protein E6G17_07975 [Actinobacteria bacterium]|nr:MAG: hypothetical protein E6G17_07975 [Actinomycetota bacterium]
MASSSIPLDSSLAGSTRDTAGAPEGGASWRWEVIRPYAGWGLAVLGAVFIVVGWIGISGESLVAKQMPYLISGGGGVALVGLGVLFLGTEERQRDRARIDQLEAMVADLHSVLLVRADGREPQASGASPAADGGNDALVALPVGQSFHRSDCVMVQGKSNAEPITAREVQARGLKPCRLCEPTLEESDSRT